MEQCFMLATAIILGGFQAFTAGLSANAALSTPNFAPLLVRTGSGSDRVVFISALFQSEEIPGRYRFRF